MASNSGGASNKGGASRCCESGFTFDVRGTAAAGRIAGIEGGVATAVEAADWISLKIERT